MKWESSCSICAWSFQGFLFKLIGRPTVVQRYRSIRASLQEVCIIDTKRTKCMMMRSCNTYCGHDFEGLWPQQLLYHSVQFDHMSQGPLKHQNSMDVTEILGKCWNHLGSPKKSQKRPKNLKKKVVHSLFHSIYFCLVKFCERWIQAIFIIILWDIHTTPWQTPVYIPINFNQEVSYHLFSHPRHHATRMSHQCRACWQISSSSLRLLVKKSWCHNGFQRLLKSKFWQPCHASWSLLNWTKCYSNSTKFLIQISPCLPAPFPSLLYILAIASAYPLGIITEPQKQIFEAHLLISICSADPLPSLCIPQVTGWHPGAPLHVLVWNFIQKWNQWETISFLYLYKLFWGKGSIKLTAICVRTV